MLTTGLRSRLQLPSPAVPADEGTALPLLSSPLSGLLTMVAVSGLAELLLQRVVYRVGVHIPREGAFLQAYQVATWSGDFAFRATAVLLAISAGLLTYRLLRAGQLTSGALLVMVLLANLLIWPLHSELGRPLATLSFTAAVAWVGLTALIGRAWSIHGVAVATVALTILLGQYQEGLPALGFATPSVTSVQLAMELLLPASALLFLISVRPLLQRTDLMAPLLVTSLLAAGYAREPSTFAIVSLWATGVTMSFSAVLYFLALAAVLTAACVWARRPETRFAAAAIALLFVAGVQPQVMHHEITALIAVLLLSLFVPVSLPVASKEEL